MEFIDPNISEYAENHTSAEIDLLKKINRQTNIEVLRPRMLSGHLQGRLLSAISHLLRPRYILEIGTYTGYSALCLAEGLQESGRLVTIERNEELEERIKGYFSESSSAAQLELRIGDALKIIPDLPGDIDLVFIDADKVNYLTYYNLVLEKLRPGGFILADNVLWSGKVVAHPDPSDIDTAALLEFNKFIQEDERVENVLLPVRDGIMLIRKK